MKGLGFGKQKGRAAHLTLFGFLALFLNGCDLAPKYDPPALLTPIPASYASAGPFQPATPMDTLPRGPWWEAYHDPLLNRLVARLNVANPTLSAAVANYDAARAYVAQVNANLFPFFIGSGWNYSIQQSQQRPLRIPGIFPNQYGDNVLALQSTYEFDLWNQIHNRIASAQASAQATAADLANVQLSLQANLVNDYIVLRSYDAQIKLLNDTVTAYASNLRLVRDRFEGKIASGIDLAQAQYLYDGANALRTQTIAQRALIEHAIASLVGEPASSFSIPPSPVLPQVPVIPTGVPSTLLQRRPDIVAAERAVAAANQQIGVARSAFFPALTLTAIGGFENSGAANLISLPLSFWTVGPNYILPLFEGGLRHAELAGAYAQYRATAAQYRATVLAAFQQVEDEMSLLNNLAVALQQQKATAADAEHYTRLATDSFIEGASNYLDVNVAETEALGAELQAIIIAQQQLQASVRLFEALGGGWSVQDLPTPRQVTDYSAQ
ncbi:MAG: efflux transporter outer membrane subunit [Acidobacteriia bacterium]|nr:efflux transporter outer membrane subunit [Methyloceanibacter sp.]MCL6492517.1 efflux transporter outer membrane subunit [Terriglobia bacterium]